MSISTASVGSGYTYSEAAVTRCSGGEQRRSVVDPAAASEATWRSDPLPSARGSLLPD